MSDILGKRGELIFSILITKFHPNRGPIFDCQFLGDKRPYLDFIVELQDAAMTKPFFFVQVKATRQGYTVKDHRLKVKVPQAHVRGLAAYPAPTYIVGIDEESERGYIVSANGESDAALSSLSTAFPIDEEHRERLWAEVRSFWTPFQIPKLASAFSDPAWR